MLQRAAWAPSSVPSKRGTVQNPWHPARVRAKAQMRAKLRQWQANVYCATFFLGTGSVALLELNESWCRLTGCEEFSFASRAFHGRYMKSREEFYEEKTSFEVCTDSEIVLPSPTETRARPVRLRAISLKMRAKCVRLRGRCVQNRAACHGFFCLPQQKYGGDTYTVQKLKDKS
ncbi:hypothetical protein CPC08DRAFT_725116 [Agrocybe pediades]|nr:hypothetical protein CPC08DRAFT_725116 [Agrocybe pediades]